MARAWAVDSAHAGSPVECAVDSAAVECAADLAAVAAGNRTVLFSELETEGSVFANEGVDTFALDLSLFLVERCAIIEGADEDAHKLGCWPGRNVRV